jgi:UbiD family decarboxylase
VTARPSAAAGGLDLRTWLDDVRGIGGLREIAAEIDPVEEAAGLTYLVGRREGAEALLFENVRGSRLGARLLFNLVGSSSARYALAIGSDPRAPIPELVRDTRDKMRRKLPPAVVERSQAPVMQNTIRGDDVDLLALGTPKHWPHDGGAYLGTADIVVTKDPADGHLNVGTYRLMLHDSRHLGIYMSPGKDALLQIQRHWAEGRSADVLAAVGIHPLGMIMGSQAFPRDVCEYDAMGGVLGKPVPVVQAERSELLMPANAEVVIEGRIHAGAVRPEGPLGEFTGYYGRPPAEAPVIEVTAIHHRDDPILTSAVMSDYPSCEQSLFFAIARSARVWDDLEALGITGIAGVWCVPAAASGLGMAVVSLRQAHPGHAAQVLALAAQSPSAAYFTKWIVAVDDDVDPTDMNAVLWAMSTRCSPDGDIDMLRNTWSTYLDPAKNPPSERPFGSKALINACKDFRHIETFSRRTTLRRSVWERIADRWAGDFGLPGSAPELPTYEDDA